MNADIAPARVILKGVRPSAPTSVQMLSEPVDIVITPDSTFVDCVFTMVNHGGAEKCEMGFPVMAFFHGSWASTVYSGSDREHFRIEYDGRTLTPDEIYVPEDFRHVYDANLQFHIDRERGRREYYSVITLYGITREKGGKLQFPSEESRMALRKVNEGRVYWLDETIRKEGDRLRNDDTYPWYMWSVEFAAGETKDIKVSYRIAAGATKNRYSRYANYLLNTGAGWQGVIGDARITVRLEGVDMRNVERVSPDGYVTDKDKKEYVWHFTDLNPGKDHDIYVGYFNPEERRRAEQRRQGRKPLPDEN